VISGAKRSTPNGVAFMPPFGTTLSNAEIASVANYVTARFGNKTAAISERDVAKLRGESAQ
jgi:mono/diheme cytochrome c family protein